LTVLSCEGEFLFYDSRDIAHIVAACFIHFISGLFLSMYFCSDQIDEPRRNLAERWTWEFLGHWKAPGSNKQDIGKRMKRTSGRRPRKLRIDEVSKLAIVRVKGQC
jgi:hypothetical protein